MGIAENIKLLRKNAGLTQKQLADKSGLSIATIQGYEQEKYEPKTEALYKLQRAFNCNINEILDKPFDLSDGIILDIKDIDNLDELNEKFKKLTGRSLIDSRKKSEDYLEVFLCYLESLGYSLSFLDISEMNKMNISAESDNDYYVGIQDDQRDNVTFFHRKDFEKFQKEIEKTIDYEIYKQFTK